MTQPDAPPNPAPEPQAEPEKTFTQADVDRLIADRLKRAKPADYDDLKAAAKKLSDIEAANASELEKAVNAAKAEGRAEVTTSANAKLISAEARAVAAEMKFKNPTLAIKAADLTDVKVGDDGDVDTEAIKAALESLAKDDPYLVGEEAPVPSFDGGARRTATPNDPRLSDLAQIEADMAASRRRK